jgi:hypothetical protein
VVEVRRSLTSLLAVVTGVLILVAGQAFAADKTATAKTVTVVMRDPGCHWFAVNGTFTTTMSVRGPVALANDDIATLKIAGREGVRRDAVGKKLTLARGSYRITMVGQASDDNILKLVVR